MALNEDKKTNPYAHPFVRWVSRGILVLCLLGLGAGAAVFITLSGPKAEEAQPSLAPNLQHTTQQLGSAWEAAAASISNFSSQAWGALKATFHTFKNALQAKLPGKTHTANNANHAAANAQNNSATPAAPRAPPLSPKQAYLNTLPRSPESIAAAIQPALLPVPQPVGVTSPALHMFAFECTRALYGAIMGTAQPGGGMLPATGMPRAQAQLFCKRLGWILNKPVRLPTAQQLQQTFINTARRASSARPGTVHTYANTGGLLQSVSSGAPSSQGFYHVLGNTEEWVHESSSATPNTAHVFGGSVKDTQAPTPNAKNLREVSPTLRSPTVGFRFVVEGM